MKRKRKDVKMIVLKKKKIKTPAVFLSLVVMLCGCSSGKSGVSDESQTSQTDSLPEKSSVTVKTYDFPEFLYPYGEAEELSSAVYTSFDEASVVVEPETQPFDGYKCTACVDGSYYIYVSDDNYGLLNGDGTELISSSGVASITAISADVLKIEYEDGSLVHFRLDGVSGEMFMPEEFDESRIGFSKQSGGEDEKDVYVLQLDGENLYETSWSSFEKADESLLDTSLEFAAFYKVSNGAADYYIGFDEYYNFTIYEKSYGFISAKVGGEYGECYISSYDDYTELQTLISSFGSESAVFSPSADETEDFVQISFGIDGGRSSVMTVSPDGCCFVETLNGENDEEAINKYFIAMGEDTFIDLINWMNCTLALEYKAVLK